MGAFEQPQNIADQLFQCCERGLGRLLIIENPDIIEEGEDALLLAIKQMAVIQIATSVYSVTLLSSFHHHVKIVFDDGRTRSGLFEKLICILQINLHRI